MPQLVGFCVGRVWHRYTTDTDFLDCTHTYIQCTVAGTGIHLTVSPVVCENLIYDCTCGFVLPIVAVICTFHAFYH